MGASTDESPADERNMVESAPLFSYWWLIVRHENAGMDILTLDGACRSSGEEVLAVFGFEEEAQMFLWYGASGALEAEGWRVRKSSGGELISVLCGPCKDVGRVALDPLPHLVFGAGSGCAWLSQNRFMERLSDSNIPPQDRHPGKGAPVLAPEPLR